MKQNLAESVNHALEGIFYVLKGQRNMRIHFLAGILVFLFGIYFNLPSISLALLALTIGVVLAIEMINTALEHLSDISSIRYHPLIKIIKDISAGAVFVTSVSSIIVGYLLFYKHLQFSLESVVIKIRQSDWHLSFIALILVISFVIIGKVISRDRIPTPDKTYTKGGMPSGHSAVAFSFWAITVFLSNSIIVIITSFIMALAIARSRIARRIHTASEVIFGALVGIFTTACVFQFLKKFLGE